MHWKPLVVFNFHKSSVRSVHKPTNLLFAIGDGNNTEVKSHDVTVFNQVDVRRHIHVPAIIDVESTKKNKTYEEDDELGNNEASADNYQGKTIQNQQRGHWKHISRCHIKRNHWWQYRTQSSGRVKNIYPRIKPRKIVKRWNMRQWTCPGC